MVSSTSGRPSPGTQGAGIFEPERLPGGVARGQRVGPVRALVEHGLREHDQRGQLAGMQRADLGLPQQRAVVAEQGAGGGIGVEDQVGVGIEQQRRLDRELERGGVEIGILRSRPQNSRARSITLKLRNFVIKLRVFVYHEFS